MQLFFLEREHNDISDFHSNELPEDCQFGGINLQRRSHGAQSQQDSSAIGKDSKTGKGSNHHRDRARENRSVLTQIQQSILARNNPPVLKSGGVTDAVSLINSYKQLVQTRKELQDTGVLELDPELKAKLDVDIEYVVGLLLSGLIMRPFA